MLVRVLSAPLRMTATRHVNEHVYVAFQLTLDVIGLDCFPVTMFHLQWHTYTSVRPLAALTAAILLHHLPSKVHCNDTFHVMYMYTYYGMEVHGQCVHTTRGAIFTKTQSNEVNIPPRSHIEAMD